MVRPTVGRGAGADGALDSAGRARYAQGAVACRVGGGRWLRRAEQREARRRELPEAPGAVPRPEPARRARHHGGAAVGRRRGPHGADRGTGRQRVHRVHDATYQGVAGALPGGRLRGGDRGGRGDGTAAPGPAAGGEPRTGRGDAEVEHRVVWRAGGRHVNLRDGGHGHRAPAGGGGGARAGGEPRVGPVGARRRPGSRGGALPRAPPPAARPGGSAGWGGAPLVARRGATRPACRPRVRPGRWARCRAVGCGAGAGRAAAGGGRGPAWPRAARPGRGA